jgi:parallel beta-helix repeat protein
MPKKSRFAPLKLSMFLILLLAAVFPAGLRASGLAAVTYYVSSSAGSDGYDGRSESKAFATIARVNALALAPGDRVLFKCGDTWRGGMLTVTGSGVAGHPITFGSYPADCADRPILSGAQPISGWTLYSGKIYVAGLTLGANAGKFAYGVNQLFRGDVRLPLGRWPDLDSGDGGYATIDAFPADNRIADNQLPAVDWTGAVAHIRGMRWYILNRQVTAAAGHTLTLGAGADCWGGDCTGWGYFLNNHLATLDRDGEWFYDAAVKKLYLYSAAGAPANGEIEGSVIYKDDDRSWGGVTLGEDLLGRGIAYVTVQNIDVRRWFRSGIALPTNFVGYEPHHLVLQDNVIRDVDAKGIDLATWVYDAADGGLDGWRGGYAMTVSGNEITRANGMGINLYSRNSTFSGNTIRDVGLVENLGAAGLGCAFDAGGGLCTEDGDGLRIKIDQAADSGNTNTVSGNLLERIAYNGMDVFGYANTFEHNVIRQACHTKGDCGGVRTFGDGSLAASPVHDLTFTANIITDTTGNTDGCRGDFDALFGFGLYIDNYSRAVTVAGNTIVNSTVHGILFQNSTGSATGNTLYDNGRTYPYGGAQIYLGEAPAALGAHTGNILYSLNPDAWTLALADPSLLGTSNNNAFFSPYAARSILAGDARSPAEWRAFSGKDGASTENWFSLSPGDPANSQIFINDTGQPKTFNLGGTVYKDLARNTVSGSLTLQPYQSQVLVKAEQCPLAGLPLYDFTGDCRTDVAVYRPSTGVWYVRNRSSTQYGVAGDLPRPGDYDGDGTADIAVYRPSTGAWYVRGQPSVYYGASGDLPIPGDYNGDGKTDIAVYRPATGAWYIRGQYTSQYGLSTDIPVPGDYNGDGRTDIAVYRPSTGAWYISGQYSAIYGAPGDVPVPGDYFGDGITDIAVYRPSTGAWYFRGHSTAYYGAPGDIPVPGDYNGDGKTDIAVFRPATGAWYVRGQFTAFYGSPGDIPIPELSTGGANAAP